MSFEFRVTQNGDYNLWQLYSEMNRCFLRDKGYLWGSGGGADGQRALYLSAAPSKHLLDTWTTGKSQGTAEPYKSVWEPV